MAMELRILDREGNTLKSLGRIDIENIELVKTIAKNYHLKCIKFVHETSDTILNQKQLESLKKDLEKLTLSMKIKTDVITFLLSSVEEVLQNKSHYLLFLGA